MSTKDQESTEDFDELKEPSLISPDPNERKLARRLRIQRRQEASKQQSRSEEEENEDKTESEKQIIASSQHLEKLIDEGEKVTLSVRVANDTRELVRREKENEIRKNLLRMLEENAKECTERYKQINEKWSHILASKDPLDIHSAMQVQNEKCLEVLAMKDKAIEQLKKELEEADTKFTLDLEKQNQDINILIDRINNQVKSMARAYCEELIFIEKTLDLERKNLLESSTKKWEYLFKQRQENEINGIEERKEIMSQYEEEVDRVMTEHHEEYRAKKIQLETESQKLERQILQMKAFCKLNCEKLNYNYMILKRRKVENAIVRNQQQRRLNKLQDVVNDLKRSYANLEEKTKLVIQKLTDQVLRAHKSILEFEEKSNHFTSINEKHYLEIWDMNTKTADELLQKILIADRIIYEQVLGLEWEPPEKKILRKEDLDSYRKSLAMIEQKKIMESERNKICDAYMPATTLEEVNLERKMLMQIMKQIADHSGFLIEEKLRKLLMKQSNGNQLIIKLGNVFQALAIESKDGNDLLLNFFLPYAYCPICTNDGNGSEINSSSVKTSASSIKEEVCGDLDEPTDERAKKLIEAVKEVVGNISPCESSERSDSIFTEIIDSSSSASDKATIEGTETNEKSSFDCFSDLKKREILCNKGHMYEIQVTYVIKALKEFIEKYNIVKNGEAPPTFKEKLIEKKFSISRNIVTDDVTKFWERYREIFNEMRECLWDAVLIGLNKYHEILKERHKLNAETESLRRQNSELHRLLETYEKPQTDLPILQLKREDTCF